MAILDLFFNNLGKILLGAGLLAGFGQVLFYILTRQPIDLPVIIQKTIAAPGVVSGIVLIICAFDTDLLKRISDLEIYILIAGIANLYISYISIFPPKSNPPLGTLDPSGSKAKKPS